MDVEALSEELEDYLSTNSLGAAVEVASKILILEQEAVPKHVRANAFAAMGLFNQFQGKLLSSADFYMRALELTPAVSDWRGRLATVCTQLHWDYRAGREITNAVNFDPENVELRICQAYVGRAICNKRMALEGANQAVEVSDRRPDAVLTLAIIEGDLSNFDRAHELCDEVISKPHPYYNVIKEARRVKGSFFIRQHGEWPKGIEYLTYCLNDGYNPEAELNLGVAYMITGDWPNGFKWMESRLKGDLGFGLDYLVARFSKPVWNGEGENLRLHVHFEQGYGDSIHFARYAQVLSSLGHDVSFEVQPELVSLFQRSFPQVRVIAAAPDYPGSYGVSDFDFHVPLLSSARLFGTTQDNVPLSSGYLVPDSEMVEYYRFKLPAGRRVGVCWAGSFRPDLGLWALECNKRRSVPERQYRESRFSKEDFVSVSLQADDKRFELSDLMDFEFDLKSWDDTAALISSLDLVVTVDTGVAHLAGALGKPVWMLCWRDSCWQWGTSGEATPWYDSMRIYRQDEANDWIPVLNRVSEDVRDFFRA